MEISDKKEFLNNDCKLFNMSLSAIKFYFLVLNIHEKSTQKLINFFKKENNELIIKPIEEDSNTFIISNLNEILPSASERNKELIKDLMINNFSCTYICLINLKGQNMITFNIGEKLEENVDVNIMGIILSQDMSLKLKELMSNNKKIIIEDFSEMTDIERISILLFEDEDVKIESDKENFNEEGDEGILNFNLENFDKEFDVDEDDVNENDHANDSLSSVKRKKSKKSRKKRHEENNEDFNDDLLLKEERKIKRKRKREEDESLYYDDVNLFTSKLREAIELDKQNFKNKKPALEKLKILPKIQKFLANSIYQKLFLQNEGLKLLQEWIKKNKDGTYPAFNQITRILEILSNLNVTLNNLKLCQIGGYVMDLSKNMLESKSIQKDARDLVQKWSRIVWDINTNYSEIDKENEQYERIYKNKKRRGEDDYSEDENSILKENTDNEKVESTINNMHKKEMDIYSHAKIPKKGLFDFTRKPVTNLNESKLEENSKIKLNYFFEKKKGGRKKTE